MSEIITGTLISNKIYPIRVIYDLQTLMIPPRGRIVIEDESKLGSLDTGLVFIKIDKK